MSPVSSDRVGDLVAQRYEIKGVIGRGGQGMVYRALDRWTDHMVAIKLLGSREAREPQMAQRMIREQQALSALKGTAAVELLDVCRSNDGELCLVMELLSGKDLDEYLYEIEQRNELLSLFRIVEIFDPIVDTLEVAHKAGIVHRDLKPANVFLLDGGGVRLLDFGLARMRSAAPLTAAGIVMGSPSFMAPEAWKGRSELLDHRADVYSLGVILFRVLTGDLPFSGESLYEKFLGSTEAKRPSLRKLRPDLPRDADEWVSQALAIDREERFSNVRALWNAFCDTFEIEPPRRGKKGPGLWAAAKSAMRRLGHSEEQRPQVERAKEPSFDREALLRSVMPAVQDDLVSIQPPTAAGASAAPAPAPVPSKRKKPPPPPKRDVVLAEKTLELTDDDFKQEEPAAPKPPARHKPPPPPSALAESTLEITDGELVITETTIPSAAAPESGAPFAPTSVPESAPTSSPESAPESGAASARDSAAPSQDTKSRETVKRDRATKKKERSRKRQQRKKERRKKH